MNGPAPAHNHNRAMPSDRFFLARRRALLTAAALAAAPALARAQAKNWPARPIKITVAYPPGGVADNLARLLAERLAPALGQTVLVDNKAGASGSIGMDAVAKAAPDGYALGFSAISPLTLNPHLGRSPFDPFRDIAPVVSVIASPVLLLGTSALAAADFKALIAAARARPGELRWATSGPASLGHIVLEQIKAGAGVNIVHVPYKGGGQQITDGLSGQFEVLSVNAGPAVMGQIKAGKLRALAVGSPARLAALPDTPTLAELGLPAANLASVFGLFAPAGAPAAVLERLNAEVNKLLENPELRQKIEAADNVPTGGSAAGFARLIAAESASNGQIIRAAGIVAD
jgi:tripartite-type tricarboxylate transporter receptor subunit TctC